MPNLSKIVNYKNKPVYDFFKRAFDIFASLLGIIVLSPLLLIVALIVKCQDGGSIFFIQKRVGRDGKKFKMVKFRSMVPDADVKIVNLLEQNEDDGPRFKIKDDPRITKFGKFMRKTSKDELPQLITKTFIFLSSLFLFPCQILPSTIYYYTLNLFMAQVTP